MVNMKCVQSREWKVSVTCCISKFAEHFRQNCQKRERKGKKNHFRLQLISSLSFLSSFSSKYKIFPSGCFLHVSFMSSLRPWSFSVWLNWETQIFFIYSLSQKITRSYSVNVWSPSQVKVDWIFPPSVICYLLWPNLAFCAVNDGRPPLDHYDEPISLCLSSDRRSVTVTQNHVAWWMYCFLSFTGEDGWSLYGLLVRLYCLSDSAPYWLRGDWILWH